MLVKLVSSWGAFTAPATLNKKKSIIPRIPSSSRKPFEREI
jgi:hypothetical protein